ncbi:uncharacterized protein BDZ99DRAFT_131374 [Mytilinidion resinicola]|uniref:Uncharacterized protein n=1 Tax=Mytilinidion resinicola TaxID=574789 RepID=A0A6A6Z7K8_9PEZI|nr:uncharacterized protein BDZ99DRAFT_131374 [Mytilinidion resinicola]KAF2816217.1 hypothetical protein BDZ99DRAFT_131374 [Mytilinidion resinicola]
MTSEVLENRPGRKGMHNSTPEYPESDLGEGEIQFITVSHPSQLKGKPAQKIIRKHVMGEVAKAKRRVQRTYQVSSNEQSFKGGKGTKALSLSWLGAGEVDPFVKYPIELDGSSRALVANIFQGKGSAQRALRNAWYSVGLFDFAAFHLVLSNSALAIQMLRNGLKFVNNEDSEVLKHHVIATRSINARLASPDHRTSDGVIGAVAGLVCHDYVSGLYERWRIHVNGLKELIALRGGIDTIKREDLRDTITWVDLCGAYCQDIPPSFPTPRSWKTYPQPFSPFLANSKFSSPLTAAFKKRMYQHPEIVSIFDDLTACTALTSYESKHLGPDYWLKSTFAPYGAWTNPTIHRLLTLRPLSLECTQETVIAEVCRAGGLLYIAPIWRKFGASPARTADLIKHLMSTLETYVVDWGELRPFLLWTMFFGCLEAPAGDERDWFLFRIAKLMRSLEMKWADYMAPVRGVMFLDEVFAGTDGFVRAEIEEFLSRVSQVNIV